jgi:peptide/nickel transport system substrate-binding protein
VLGNLSKYILYFLFLVAFVWISGQLFFEDRTNAFMTSLYSEIFPADKVLIKPITDFRILYPEGVSSLEPTLTTPNIRQRLLNLYEPLVKPNRDLKIVPALALSWGLIDDYTWDFLLRPNVKFHDGSSFDAADVIASFNRGLDYPASELADFLETIEEIKVINDYEIQIVTKKPDPLLLRKLSQLLIIPSEYESEDLSFPVGTASYKLSSNPNKESENLFFQRFDDYWGKKSVFDSVEIFVENDKLMRLNMLFDGEVDFLAFVPQDAVTFVKQRHLKVATIPSLEVQFLVFNLNSEFMGSEISRNLVSLAIDQNELIDSLGDFVHPVNQYVSNGVFGYNPNLPQHFYDLDKARELFFESNLYKKTLKLHLPIGLEVLGEHIRIQLNKVGVSLVVSYLSEDAFVKSILSGDADIYSLGFKSDLGNALEFFQTLVYSGGDFNVFNYSNSSVDGIIDDVSVEMNAELRLTKLHEAMKVIVDDNIIGVPLFEYETVYSFVPQLDMQPRIDGFIYFDDLNTN